MLSIFRENLPLRVHGQFIWNTLGRVQATWLGSAGLFWCVNIANKLHGVVAARGLRKEIMPICFLGASPSFSSGSCDFSISDPLSLKSGLGGGSLPAGWSQTINESSFALLYIFGILSGKENVSDTVLFPKRFLWYNLVKLNQSCVAGSTKSKLFKTKLTLS